MIFSATAESSEIDVVRDAFSRPGAYVFVARNDEDCLHLLAMASRWAVVSTIPSKGPLHCGFAAGASDARDLLSGCRRELRALFDGSTATVCGDASPEGTVRRVTPLDEDLCGYPGNMYLDEMMAIQEHLQPVCRARAGAVLEALAAGPEYQRVTVLRANLAVGDVVMYEVMVMRPGTTVVLEKDRLATFLSALPADDAVTIFAAEGCGEEYVVSFCHGHTSRFFCVPVSGTYKKASTDDILADLAEAMNV